MYAIVKTGGKQYKVAAGDILVTEKLQGEIGDKVELQAIAVVDGTKVVADPAEAGKTKVVATIVASVQGRQGPRLQVQEAQELQEAARPSPAPHSSEDREHRLVSLEGR